MPLTRLAPRALDAPALDEANVAAGRVGDDRWADLAETVRRAHDLDRRGGLAAHGTRVLESLRTLVLTHPDERLWGRSGVPHALLARWRQGTATGSPNAGAGAWHALVERAEGEMAAEGVLLTPLGARLLVADSVARVESTWLAPDPRLERWRATLAARVAAGAGESDLLQLLGVDGGVRLVVRHARRPLPERVALRLLLALGGEWERASWEGGVGEWEEMVEELGGALAGTGSGRTLLEGVLADDRPGVHARVIASRALQRAGVALGSATRGAALVVAAEHDGADVPLRAPGALLRLCGDARVGADPDLVAALAPSLLGRWGSDDGDVFDEGGVHELQVDALTGALLTWRGAIWAEVAARLDALHPARLVATLPTVPPAVWESVGAAERAALLAGGDRERRLALGRMMRGEGRSR